MRRLVRATMLAVLFTGVATALATGTADAATTAPATAAPTAAKSASGQDGTFLIQNVQTDLAEISAGKLAEQRATTAAIRDTARIIVRDHQRRRHIRMPMLLTEEVDELLANLGRRTHESLGR